MRDEGWRGVAWRAGQEMMGVVPTCTVKKSFPNLHEGELSKRNAEELTREFTALVFFARRAPMLLLLSCCRCADAGCTWHVARGTWKCTARPHVRWESCTPEPCRAQSSPGRRWLHVLPLLRCGAVRRGAARGGRCCLDEPGPGGPVWSGARVLGRMYLLQPGEGEWPRQSGNAALPAPGGSRRLQQQPPAEHLL